MAIITVGTGSTFKATTVEGQLKQAIEYYQNGERSSTETDRFTSTKDDTFIMSGNFTIPGTINYDATTGLFTPVAAPYLPTLIFSPGSPAGTIKCATLAQYFINLCHYIVRWQNLDGKNPNSKTNLTLNFNYSTLLYSGEFTLPYSVTLTDTGIVEIADEWLVT